MKLLFHILKRNDELKIDNETVGLSYIIMKLKEECNEVVDSIINYSKDRTLNNLKNIISETFDLIQMCILILRRCYKEANNLEEYTLIQEMNLEHKNKLVNRNWIIETGIEIDVKE